MTKPVDRDDPFTDEVFQFLDDLRDSGKTNMFGAGPYLAQAFGFSQEDARGFLKEWMVSFGERHPE